MDAKELQIGMKISLFAFTKADILRKRRAGYVRSGNYFIEAMNDRMIRLRKDEVGYMETVSIIDLRQKVYKMQAEDGTEINFTPMVDIKKVEQARIDHDIEEYRKTNPSVSRKEVQICWDRGMTPEEIVDELHSSLSVVKGLLASMGLIEKKNKNQKKVEGSEMRGETLSINRDRAIEICNQLGSRKDVCNKIAEEFNVSAKQAEKYICNHGCVKYLKNDTEKKPTGRPKKQLPAAELSKLKGTEEIMEGQPATGEQMPGSDLPPVKSAEEISAINSHEEHPESATIPEQPETEEYPDIKEAAEEVGRKFGQVAKESMDRCKLAHEVDKMLELIPDPEIDHPVHYTVGKIEVIDCLQDKMPPEMFEGFCVGNALKYISRYRFKGGVADLKKAAWYLNRIIGVKETA
jgi:hypothetical protein